MPAAWRVTPAPRIVWGIALCGLLLSGRSFGAHHSLSGYDSSVPVTIEGVVARFQFTNPHPFLIVTVTDAQGAKKEWRLEMDNRFELEAIGMTSRTLMPGDRVVVTGSRGRTELTSLYVRRLDRPADGFWYEQVGSTPRIR